MSETKTVIVTGAASGIGKATAQRFHKDGFNVVLADVNAEGVTKAAQELGDGRATGVTADMSNKAAVQALVDKTIATYDRIDVVVNNAGIGFPGTPDTLSDEHFDIMLNVNVRGVRWLSLAALPHLRKHKGNIVNVSSVSGIRGDWGLYGYDTSKGAVSLMTQAMALDLGKEGIRINAVAPTVVATAMTASLKDHPEVVELLNTRIPLGRIAQPEDIASAIAFLAGPDAGFITGVVLPVDGGVTASNGQPFFAHE